MTRNISTAHIPRTQDLIMTIMTGCIVHSKATNQVRQAVRPRHQVPHQAVRPSSAPTVTTRQLQPVQEWNPCLGCGGTGLCTYCQGKGKRWYGNSYENCITCHGSMYCQQCYGRKGYYTTVYR